MINSLPALHSVPPLPPFLRHLLWQEVLILLPRLLTHLREHVRGCVSCSSPFTQTLFCLTGAPPIPQRETIGAGSVWPFGTVLIKLRLPFTVLLITVQPRRPQRIVPGKLKPRSFDPNILS